MVDDGSTDETPQVAERYGERIRYDRTPNRGLSAARNQGARLATGELIVFLDADNRLDPSFVSDTVAALQADPRAAFAYTQLRHFGDRAVETQEPPWDPERLRDGNYIDACALIHIDLVRRFPFDESNRIGWEDWDFWLTLAEHGYRGTLVDKPLVEYRRHDEAMTGQIAGMVRLDLRASVLRRHRAYVGRRRWWRAEVRRLRQRLGLARRRISRISGGDSRGFEVLGRRRSDSGRRRPRLSRDQQSAPGPRARPLRRRSPSTARTSMRNPAKGLRTGVETPSDRTSPIMSPWFRAYPLYGRGRPSRPRKIPLLGATIRRSSMDSVSPMGKLTGVSCAGALMCGPVRG